jgi:hypothetical protein
VTRASRVHPYALGTNDERVDHDRGRSRQVVLPAQWPDGEVVLSTGQAADGDRHPPGPVRRIEVDDASLTVDDHLALP